MSVHDGLESGSATEKSKSISDVTDIFRPSFASHERHGSVISATCNLVCTSLDGTTLAIPYIFSKCGVVVAPILFLLFSISTIFTLEALCVNSKKLGVPTYSAIVEKVLGLASRIVFNTLLICVVFGQIVGFLIFMKDVGTDIVEYIADYNIFPVYVMLFGAGVSFPIMLQKTLYDLRYVCYLGCFCVFCLFTSLLVVLILHKQTDVTLKAAIQIWPESYLGVESIPIVAVLHIPHLSVTDIHEQIHKPTKERILKVVTSTSIIMFCMYTAIGFIGYISLITMFHDEITDNILDAFPAHDKQMIFARFTMFVTFICTIHVMMVSARDFISSLEFDVYEAVELARGRIVYDAEMQGDTR